MIELKFLLYQDFKRVKLQHMFFHSGVNEKKWLNKNLQKIMKMTMMNMVHCLLLLSAWESEAWETFVQIFLSHKPIQCSICICCSFLFVFLLMFCTDIYVFLKAVHSSILLLVLTLAIQSNVPCNCFVCTVFAQDISDISFCRDH